MQHLQISMDILNPILNGKWLLGILERLNWNSVLSSWKPVPSHTLRLLLGMLSTHDRVGVTCAKEANIGNICKPVCMCMEAEGNIVLNCMGMATGHPVMPELEFGSSGPYASL